eukprot:TRINITY_DN3435_c0_g1_i1.p1 TRINITY_DN3435_c0_g1~~TRINITY_DN3435_c0_g1_i1.p1  ORF type:complete len:868 (+),score=113.93 TRINITY_DN3435_c0_g1_i1:378-2606(+)
MPSDAPNPGRSFPGAMGPGTTTPGGRYGKLLVVSSLEDDEEKVGTLRWALEQDYPRFIVFSVGGVIKLKENLQIKNKCFTVAGHSAPPPGITIAGASLRISTSDAVMRYVRLRSGDGGCTRALYMDDRQCNCERDGDVLTVQGGEGDGKSLQRVVIDHISAAWSLDETISPQLLESFTMSYCHLTQALHNGCHEEDERGKGPDLTQKGDHYEVNRRRDGDRRRSLSVNNHGYGTLATKFNGGDQMAFHHNLWSHMRGRVPKISNQPTGSKNPGESRFSIINNVIYGGDSGGPYTDGNEDKSYGVRSDWIGNVREYVDKMHSAEGEKTMKIIDDDPKYIKAGSNDKIYAKDNMEKHKDKWNPRGSDQKTLFGKDGASLQSKPYGTSYGWEIVPDSTAQDAYADVLAHAGVWNLPDRVDAASFRLIKDHREVRIDAPGGCCVKRDCHGSRVVDKSDCGDDWEGCPMVDKDDCKLAPCAENYFEDSSKCSGDNSGNGITDQAIDDLNKDLSSGTGVDWESKYGRSQDFSLLEAELEKCPFPTKGGHCLDNPSPSPPPSPSPSPSPAPPTACTFSDGNTEIRRRISKTCTELKERGECEKWGGFSARRRGDGGSVADTCAETCFGNCRGSTPTCSDGNTEIRRRISKTCTELKERGECEKWGGFSARRRGDGGSVADTCAETCFGNCRGSTPTCSDGNTEIRRRVSKTCAELKNAGECNSKGGASARRRGDGGRTLDTCSCTCGFS